MTTAFIIAIDGPAASGKGSLAKKLAGRLGFAHLDTGLLYRRTGLDALKNGGDPGMEADALAAARALNPADLADPALKSDEAGNAASQAGQFASVRQALLDFQRHFAAEARPGAVLDGRDIGTVICPDAAVKLYVTADVTIRAKRRLKELQSQGLSTTYEAVLEEMKARDARDAGREAAPMKPAADAHIIDTGALSPEDVLQAALDIVAKIRA